MAAEMFRVTPIEGKGFGIVATKFIKRGTLIIKEVSQIPHFERPSHHLSFEIRSWKKYFQAVLSSFDEMSESDQEEYLKLHNRCEFEERLKLMYYNKIMAVEKDGEKAAKILKIVGIYQTNKFEDGLRIKTSRFNHSCFPNATTILENSGEIRAVYDIKEGQEITIKYQGSKLMSMKKREYRQKILLEMGFTCFCDLCKKQDGMNQTETETKIEELIKEVEKLDVDEEASSKSTTPMMARLLYPPEKCRRHIECFKKLYNLGKEEKTHRRCLYYILNRGYIVANWEYQICFSNRQVPNRHQFLEEFKKECVSFAKAAEGFGKLLGEELVKPEVWKKRYQNFEKEVMKDMLQ